MAILKDIKLSQAESEQMVRDMSPDLIAYYNLLQSAAFRLITEAQEKNWTEDQLIIQIENLFDNEGIEAQAVQEVSKSINISKVCKNYKLQGKMEFQDMPISIENRKGSVRQGIDDNGHEWKIKMKFPYGYIRMTEGTDGDHVDVYIGENKNSQRVYIIHQNNPDTGKYDEDKIMLGFNSAGEAKEAYLQQYDRPGFYGSTEVTTIEKFKELLKNNKGKKLTLRKSLELFNKVLKDKIDG